MEYSGQLRATGAGARGGPGAAAPQDLPDTAAAGAAEGAAAARRQRHERQPVHDPELADQAMLIARDTIEEKVMALKARKGELFASVVDEGNVFGGRLDED